MHFVKKKSYRCSRLLNRKLVRTKKPIVRMPDGSIRTLSPTIMGLAKRMSQRLQSNSS